MNVACDKSPSGRHEPYYPPINGGIECRHCNRVFKSSEILRYLRAAMLLSADEAVDIASDRYWLDSYEERLLDYAAAWRGDDG